MAYTALLTNLGLAKIAAAIAASSSISIATGKVGDGLGSPVTPDATWTDLARVVYTGTLDNLDVSPGSSTQVFAELKIPAASGGFTIREVGLYDTDGDLIAVASFPQIYKPSASEGATLDLIIRLKLEVSNTDAITLVVDTSVVIASRSWVDANYSLSALIPGGTTHQILRKHSNADGDTEWADPTEVNVVVDVIQETQTLATSQVIVDLTICTTVGAAVYINGSRLLPSAWTATTTTRITLGTSYTSGSKILIVQNEPAGVNDYLRTANNLSDVGSVPAARENLGLLTDDTYLTALWKLLNQKQYPVGEIYTTRQAGNPSAILGFGTWVAYGEGRVLVGYDSADSSFNAVDKTGGEKTHVLTTAEMAKHGHPYMLGGIALSGHGGMFISAADFVVTKPAWNGTPDPYDGGKVIGGSGGDQPHNNLQPYITVFMWRRTA